MRSFPKKEREKRDKRGKCTRKGFVLQLGSGVDEVLSKKKEREKRDKREKGGPLRFGMTRKGTSNVLVSHSSQKTA